MFSLVGLFHCDVCMLYNRLITNSFGYHGRLVREWMEREKQNSLTRWTHRNENSWIQFIEWYSCTPCNISLRLKHFHPILYHSHTPHFLYLFSLSCELGGRLTFPPMVLKRILLSFPIPRPSESKMFCNKPFSHSILCKSISFHIMTKPFHRNDHSD